jgi:ATP-binding protein involved in chromosome partitioning
MFKQMEVPVFGFVENMSYFQPPGTTERYEIFGHGGGKKLAEEMEVPFLGEVPLETAIRQGGDLGKPIVVADPNSGTSQAFIDIAKQVAAQISIHALTPA